MRDNPELELEQAADPGRLVRTTWDSYHNEHLLFLFLQEKEEKPAWKE